MSKKYDFSGWVTRNDTMCSDGRIIKQNAFQGNDGEEVPLVWNHDHGDVFHVLGTILLENRPEGVYGYGSFNDTDAGATGKKLVRHGDIKGLSIYANKLKQQGPNVIHGVIREVSLVLAGANPGAYIDAVISHGDMDTDEALVYVCNDYPLDIKHSDESEEQENMDEETIQDVFDTLSEKQKNVVYAMIGMAIHENQMAHADDSEDEDTGEETIQDVFETLSEKQKKAVYAIIGLAIENENSDEERNDEDMRHNAFYGDDYENDDNVISHSEMMAVINDAKRFGSMRESALQHGIENIDYLFPDDTNVQDSPSWVKREDAWVSKVMDGVHHTPFSRIRSMFADITADEARAKGYIKGNMKTEEVFSLFKRSTGPTTIYKKQRLHRDDEIDITDFDIVAWMKAEMRGMLNEEIARAILVGDGRSASDDDKINEQNIRPIWKDHDVYTIKNKITITAATTADQKAKAFIRAVVKSRKDYKGSGDPTLYTTEDIITDCLLMEDATGRIIYDTLDKLKTALRVKDIVTVPVMENQTRVDDDSHTLTLGAILVNLKDYNVGADKGGNVSMFDDFDIDYNQQKYLIETRLSGALIRPYSAIAFEFYTQA